LGRAAQLGGDDEPRTVGTAAAGLEGRDALGGCGGRGLGWPRKGAALSLAPAGTSSLAARLARPAETTPAVVRAAAARRERRRTGRAHGSALPAPRRRGHRTSGTGSGVTPSPWWRGR